MSLCITHILVFVILLQHTCVRNTHIFGLYITDLVTDNSQLFFSLETVDVVHVDTM